MIPYGKQDINQADIDAVVDILQSDFLTQGPAVQLFESKLTEYCDAKYAVAVNNATWTSGEPVSVSVRPKFETISFLFSVLKAKIFSSYFIRVYITWMDH